MRTHARVLCSIWRNEDFRGLSKSSQWLYLMLISSPDINNAGVAPLRVNKWSKLARDVDVAVIATALSELQQRRFVCFDTETEEVLVRTFIRNDGVEKQPNVLKNALRAADTVESARLRQALSLELEKIDKDSTRSVAANLRETDISDPYETGSEPFEGFEASSSNRAVCGDGDGEGVVVKSSKNLLKFKEKDTRGSSNSSQSPDSSPEPKADVVKPKRYDPRFESWWQVYPRRIGKGAAEKKWSKAVKDGVDPALLEKAAAAYADHVTRTRTEAKFVKHPATWLNQECWNDELDSGPKPQAPQSRTWDMLKSAAENHQRQQELNR